MPLINDQITQMDEARMNFIEALNDHCHKLREELRITELLMHSVIKSLSVQTEATSKLDIELEHIRQEGSMHKPYINDANRKAALMQIEDALKGAVKRVNNGDKPTQ